MAVFRMPSLGADMESGKLVEWLVAPGDKVAKGDVVAVVETQKGAIEIECFQAGVVARLEAELGETLPVGAPLATITKDGAEPEPADAAESAQPVEKPAKPVEDEAKPDGKAAPKPKTPKPMAPAGKSGKERPLEETASTVPASPAARARAAEAGLELAELAGTGPGGAVLLADVEAFLAGAREPEGTESQGPAPEAPTRKKSGTKAAVDPVAMRAAISAAMSRSKREIPHYYLARTIDLQPATGWLARTNEESDPDSRILMGALFLRATALAAARVPELNGQFEDGSFRPSETVNAGLAIAMRGGGLIAPAIRGAQALTLVETMSAMRELVERTRNGRLRNSEMTEGTITVSSIGDGGADLLFPVIYPPQVAIIGFGAPARRPWVVDDLIAPRVTVTVTLAADHRVSDGRRGARLLSEIERNLMEPENL